MTIVTRGNLREPLRGLLAARSNSISWFQSSTEDHETMRRALVSAELEHGPIDTVFHLAGESKQRSLLDETPASLSASMEGKATGALVLEELLRERSARLVLFSSIIGITGAPGHAAYAAANGFLDGLAQARGAPSSVMSVSFGAWRGVGMSSTTTIEGPGQVAFSIEQALAALTFALRQNSEVVVCGLIPGHPAVRRWAPGEGLATQQVSIVRQGDESFGSAPKEVKLSDRFGTPNTAEVRHVRVFPRLEDGRVDRTALRAALRGRSSAVEPRDALERILLAVWREVLEISDLGVEDSFLDSGGHSLHAARAVGKMKELTGTPVSIRLLFEAPSVRQLADRLRPTQTSADETGKRVDVSSLSDVDVDRMLKELLSRSRPTE